MPAEPIRERILVAIVDRLKAISTATGSWLTPKRVSRKAEFLDAVAELPIYIVLPSDQENEKTYEEVGSGGSITATMGVEIVAMAEGSDTVVVSTFIERMAQDVEKALTTPDLQVGLDAIGVEDVRDTGRFEMLELPTDEWYRGLRSMIYRVVYNYALGAP